MTTEPGVVEIVARWLFEEEIDIEKAPDLLTVITADGRFKIMEREATSMMRQAMHSALYRWRELQGDPQQDPTNDAKHGIRFGSAFDVAPRWPGEK
jgi:hypothetical protein